MNDKWYKCQKCNINFVARNDECVVTTCPKCKSEEIKPTKPSVWQRFAFWLSESQAQSKASGGGGG